MSKLAELPGYSQPTSVPPSSVYKSVLPTHIVQAFQTLWRTWVFSRLELKTAPRESDSSRKITGNLLLWSSKPLGMSWDACFRAQLSGRPGATVRQAEHAEKVGRVSRSSGG